MENLATFLALMVKLFPVCGFLPVRAFLLILFQVPKPTMRTSLPDFNAFSISVIVASITFMQEDFDSLVCLETAVQSSCLFILFHLLAFLRFTGIIANCS